MKILYVDNFRGFDDTYIPIKQVNFLVGENSTGKTSILSLINLLSTPHFWFKQEFNTEEVQLGTFREIVSIRSSTKDKFKIGVLEFEDEGDNTHRHSFLLTFIQDHGLPIASQYEYYADGRELNIDFTKSAIRYKSKVFDLKKEDTQLPFRVFKRWTKRERLTKDFKQMKEGIPGGRKHSLLAAAFLVDTEVKQKKGAKTELGAFVLPSLVGELAWFAPIRSKPKRTYDEFRIDFTSEGAHTPYLVRKLLDNPRVSGGFRKFLSEFGRESALLDSVAIEEFGHKPTSPFSLNVVLDDKSLNIKNVGYGVSQCLPVVVEAFARGKKIWFAIQQPEIHLHPKAQASLGDLFYTTARDGNKRFLIETHSDYIIDRFRLNYRRPGPKVESQVLFFERTRAGNKVTAIDIKKDGEYSPEQPKKFREFFIKEELKLLGVK